jgi:hydroxyacylglutathione hydrolase
MTVESRSTREAEPDEPFFRISAGEARQRIEAGGARVVDVRPRREYAAAHIAGSVNIDVDDLFKRRAELPLADEIVVVCRIGVVSVLGAEILALLGCKRAYNLEGGIEDWERQGFPLDRSEST